VSPSGAAPFVVATMVRSGDTGAVSEVAREHGRVLLRMYVARDSAPSAQARRQLAALRQRLGGERWDVEVVDVFERPALAEADRVLATPVLIRLLPEPRLSVIGDFSDSHAVAVALDLEGAMDR
jgi:circadian clock protein KaiB